MPGCVLLSACVCVCVCIVVVVVGYVYVFACVHVCDCELLMYTDKYVCVFALISMYVVVSFLCVYVCVF